MKILKGDTVLVITGKDKGKKGTVLRVLTSKNRIVVSGINMRTKHIKKTTQSAGQRIQFEAGIAIGNVMLLDPKTGKPSRVGYKVDQATGKKVRIAKVSGTVLERVAAAKISTAADKKTTEKPAKKEKEKGTSAAPKKKPFWKGIGFGSDVTPHGDDPTSHNAPGAEEGTHHERNVGSQSRAGSRGS